MAEFFAAGLGPSPEGANALAWQSLFSEPAPASGWSVPEAFFCVLFRAATCDGDLAALEFEHLLALAHRSRALAGLTEDQLCAVNTAVAARLAAGPAHALRQACAALPQEMHASVFAHALDLVLCDGALVDAEAAFLNELIAALELAPAERDRICEVLLVKNLY